MSADTDIDFDAISFAISSTYRKRALTALADHPQTPSDIADDDIAHISRALGQLRERGYVDLLVSEDTRKGRLYGLTDDGQTLVEDARALGKLDGQGGGQ